MEYRIETDSMGEMKVPVNRRYGAQTQRSLENFRIGTEKMPEEIIKALCEIKKAAAEVNLKLGLLEERVARAIIQAADEVLAALSAFKDDFALSVWQTGSGTQTNMNVNEVLAHRASELLGARVHPNDHVNKSQSSNDVFPSAMHLAAREATGKLESSARLLESTFAAKAKKFMQCVKTGRTHLQDATPLTLGQEISGWAGMLDRDAQMLSQAARLLSELALGGTAVGTGINAPPNFDVLACEELSRNVGAVSPARNKFQALTSKDELVFVHGAVKALAMDLLKIANDVRWMASGPRCGLGEITIPENEPGSSIMPGKVNPTQCEAVSMVAAQVLGNDVAVAFAAGQGNFELNVYMPVLIYNFLQSCRLLTDVILLFDRNCAQGIEANLPRLESNASRSLMNVTALTPVIGYDKAAQIAKKAHLEGLTLKEAASGVISEEDFNQHLHLLGMGFPGQAKAAGKTMQSKTMQK